MFISVQRKKLIKDKLSEQDFKMWNHYNMWCYAKKMIGDFESAYACVALRDNLTKDLFN